jgi:methyltransferase
MAQRSQAQAMEQAIRTYIQACNDADASAIAACFRSDAVHYFPFAPKWSGASTIGDNFAKRVGTTGQWWTVDRVVCDADQREAVLEWTRFDPSSRQILRGVDWFVFNAETMHIHEIRPYVAGTVSADAARQELQEFDYEGRGYPTTFLA